MSNPMYPPTSSLQLQSTMESLAEKSREALGVVMANRERYVAAFIAETGLLPSECEMVETTVHGHDSVTTTMRIQKRGAQ